MKSSRVDLTVISRNLSAVARLMGYTPNGLRDLIGAETNWILIGTTRRDKSRIYARRSGASTFEFTSNASIATGAQMPEDAIEANRVRREIADSIVARVKSSRTAETQSIVRHANSTNRIEAANCGKAVDKIISPVAPRDHTTR